MVIGRCCICTLLVAQLKTLFKEKAGKYHEKTDELLSDPGYINDILKSGVQKASQIANSTLVEVHEIMGLFRPD